MEDLTNRLLRRAILVFIPSLFCLSIAAAPPEPNTYVYLTLGGSKLAIYNMNPETGELTFLQNQATQDAPFYLTANPAKTVLYVGHWGGSKNAISAYSINQSTGLLTSLNSIDLPYGPVHMHVEKTGKFIFSAPYKIPTATISPLDGDGKLLEPVTEIKTDVKPHQLVTDNSNKFAYIPCLGSDNIHLYQFNAVTGALSPETPKKIAVKKGAGPRLLEFHGSKSFVYLANELDNTVTAYSLNQTDGALTEINTLSTVPASHSKSSKVSEIHITPDNNFIYVANRGHNSLAGYSIDATAGSIKLIDIYPTEATPRSFSISPNGKFLFAAGKSSGKMAAYNINQATGVLTKFKTLDVGSSPSCVLSLRLGEVVGCTDTGAVNYNAKANTPCHDCCEFNTSAAHKTGNQPYRLSFHNTFLHISIAVSGSHQFSVYDVHGTLLLSKRFSNQGEYSVDLKPLSGILITEIRGKASFFKKLYY